MTQEEKAKAYDNLIKRLKNFQSKYRFKTIEESFPELKESKDEKIKEGLINYFNNFHLQTFAGLNPKNILAWLEKQGEQKPVDKVEPKFRVKYAGSEYNVLEVKDIAGVTYYGIEDEPNHIDYVLPDNCEIVSEQKPTWSEEDESRINRLILYFEDKESFTAEDDVVYANWLKSLKERYTWKPNDEQIKALEHFVRSVGESGYASPYDNDIKLIYSLLEQLKQL